MQSSSTLILPLLSLSLLSSPRLPAHRATHSERPLFSPLALLGARALEPGEKAEFTCFLWPSSVCRFQFARSNKLEATQPSGANERRAAGSH